MESQRQYNYHIQQSDLPNVSKDAEGYVQSFSIDQRDEYLKFFDEFGFVVIRNALNKDEVNDSVDDIWNIIEGKESRKDVSQISKADSLYLQAVECERSGKFNEAAEFYRRSFHLKPELEDDDIAHEVIRSYRLPIDRDDASTWGNQRWPSAQSVGFLGHEVPTTKISWNNRLHPNLYNLFSTLMNTKELWVSIDRYGIMRPTKNVPIGPMPSDKYRTSVKDEKSTEIEKEDKPMWQSISSWTHWDLNPWKWTLNKLDGVNYTFDDFISENNGSKNDGIVKLQGVLCISDSNENDGGFCCVPGFHKHIEKWSNLTKDSIHCKANEKRYDLVSVPGDDSINKYLEKITARAGSMIVWSSELPHCNYPNDSSNFRMSQYIKMFPAKEGFPGTDNRKLEIQKMIPQDMELNPLSKKLLGLESWSK